MTSEGESVAGPTSHTTGHHSVFLLNNVCLTNITCGRRRRCSGVCRLARMIYRMITILVYKCVYVLITEFNPG